MIDNILSIRRQLESVLSQNRYEHTLGVAATAVCLAMKYEADLYQAETAGLLHDCAKCFSDDILLERCQEYHIAITDAEKANPSLLHAKLGAFFAMNSYRITDMDVINAILYHTTGRPSMNLLEKIVFVADYIEPRRDKAPHLKEIRRVAFEDLDRAVWLIMEDTLSYLKHKHISIDDMTEKACRYYRELVKGTENHE